ncbi:MAG: hypothetical protein IJ807_04500 [Eubacterium sp.]|nr:hypothetical protein [Eubacterium sp.]
MGDPQDELRIIHITGTNGKGSTGAFITSVLCEAGYRVGRFSSPAVTDEWECIRVFDKNERKTDPDNRDDIFADAIERVNDICMDMLRDGYEEPTVFEKQTALMYYYFYNKKVDVAVVEVGMGGRGDATNINKSCLAAVFTSVSVDHERFLGDTIPDIIKEKSGIIKKNCSVIVSDGGRIDTSLKLSAGSDDKQDSALIVYNALKKHADEIGADVHPVDMGSVRVIRLLPGDTDFMYEDREYRLISSGVYQIYNACLAIKTIEVLIDRYGSFFGRINYDNIQNGLRGVSLPARLEIIKRDPVVIFDGAHNPDAVKLLGESMKRLFPDSDIYAVMGVYADKDYKTMVDIAAGFCDELCAIRADGERALDPGVLTGLWMNKGRKAYAAGSVFEAVSRYTDMIRDSKNDGVILVFGSLSLRRSYLASVDRKW